MIEIAVKNLSSVVSQAELAASMSAFQTQVSRDFASVWGIDAKLHLLERSAALPGGAWQLNVFDNSDEASALGYHETTAKGLPLGKVFAKTTLDYGGIWSVTFSHELLEMLLDPYINLTAIDPHSGRVYAYEAADAVEADELGYKIGATTVSDFVLPSFWEPDITLTKTHKRSFCGHVTKPFELATGGYLAYWTAAGGWTQINAKKPDHHAGHGSRFARRLKPHHERRHSIAE